MFEKASSAGLARLVPSETAQLPRKKKREEKKNVCVLHSYIDTYQSFFKCCDKVSDLYPQDPLRPLRLLEILEHLLD